MLALSELLSYRAVCPSVRRRPSINFHIFDFSSESARWTFMKLCRDEVLMVPNKCCCFPRGGSKGGGAKIGQGSPSSKNFFFRPEGYSDKPNAYQWSIACGMKRYFLFHSELKFLTRFDVFLDLVILPYFNSISIDFYAVKCLIYMYSV